MDGGSEEQDARVGGSPPRQVPIDEALRVLWSELRDPSLDFVARLNTVWTLVGLEAWLARQERELRGVVLVVASSLTHPSVVPPGTRAELARHPGIRLVEVAPYGSVEVMRELRRVRMRRLLRLPMLVGARGRELRYVVPRRPDFALLGDALVVEAARQRPVVFEILDEGFGGTTVPGWHSLEMRAIELGDRVSRRVFRTVDHGLCDLDAQGRRTRVRPEIASRVRRVIERHSGRYMIPRSDTRPIALLLTSYWAEYGRMTEQAERALCGRVVRRLLDKGYAVWIKQHPREQLGRYDEELGPLLGRDVRMLPRDMSAEAFFPEMDATRDVLVGLISNAHYVGQLLFDLDVVVLRGADWGSTSFSATQDEDAYLPLFPRRALGLDELPPASR